MLRTLISFMCFLSLELKVEKKDVEVKGEDMEGKKKDVEVLRNNGNRKLRDEYDQSILHTSIGLS